MSLAPKPVPAWAKPIVDRLEDHNERLDSLESVYKDINEATEILKKIWRAIKWGMPSLISAAVAAGYVNGDFAKLLNAIFGA